MPLDQHIRNVFSPETNPTTGTVLLHAGLLTARQRLLGRIAPIVSIITRHGPGTSHRRNRIFECINIYGRLRALQHSRRAPERVMEAMDGPINFGETR